jgi:hypothetical protein
MSWTRVQGVAGSNSGSTPVSSASVTLSAVGSGGSICGVVDWGGGNGTLSASLTSVTDDKGNNYHLEPTPLLNVTDDQYYIGFSLTNITNAPTVLTANFSDSDGFRGIAAEEFSGGSTASTDERDVHTGQYQSSPGTGTDAITSGSVTTTVDGDLLWGAVGFPVGNSLSPGTGFTSGFTGNGGINSEYRVQTTAGAGTAATFTTAFNCETSTFLITLKAPASDVLMPQIWL